MAGYDGAGRLRRRLVDDVYVGQQRVAATQFRLSFCADSGTALTSPVTFPQTGTGPFLGSAIEGTLNAALQTNGSVSGFAIFRSTNGGSYQEAVVPLETRTATDTCCPSTTRQAYRRGGGGELVRIVRSSRRRDPR